MTDYMKLHSSATHIFDDLDINHPAHRCGCHPLWLSPFVAVTLCGCHPLWLSPFVAVTLRASRRVQAPAGFCDCAQNDEIAGQARNDAAERPQ